MSSIPLINVNSFKFVVIIPAAGTSERFGSTSSSFSASSLLTNGTSSSTSSSYNQHIAKSPRLGTNSSRASFSAKGNQGPPPKQYSVICNKPLIFHTVTNFLKLKWIDHIVVVAPTESLSTMEDILAPLAKQQQKRFDCIPGSSSRHRSIKAGVEFLTIKKSIQPDMVIIHDGARPYLDGEVLHQLVSLAYDQGVSGVTCPLTSTVVATQNGPSGRVILNQVLDRSKFVASETPQAFRFNLLADAYRKCTDQDLDHNTECLDLVQRYAKFDAALLPVDPSLYFKVTYRKDLYAADAILKEQRNILLHCDFICEKQNVNYKFIKQLKDDLCAAFATVKYFNNSMEMKHTHHSAGTVHVLLHYCDQWTIVPRQNLAAYENLVYIVVNSQDPGELTQEAHSALIQWSKTRRSKEIKNFYLIFTHIKNLDQDSPRIRKIVVYLSKELPLELSGQTFFM